MNTNDVLTDFNNIEFLTDEEINEASFFELALYLQNLNIAEYAIKEIVGKDVIDNGSSN